MTTTLLAQLIQEHVSRSVAATLALDAERAGEELARDILKDPEFREDMRALVRAAFRRALEELTREPGGAQ